MGCMPNGKQRVRSAYDTFNPDYTIFKSQGKKESHPIWAQAMKSGCSVLVSKEEYGNDRFNGNSKCNECNYKMFPDQSLIRKIRPAFLFRHPFDVFDSWLARGWQDVKSFILCFNTLYNQFNETKIIIPETLFYIHDRMISSNESQVSTFNAVCSYWNLLPKYRLDFDTEFGSDFLYWNDREKDIYVRRNPKGIFDTVKNSSTIIRNTNGHGLIEMRHKEAIQQAGVLDKFHDILNLDKECQSY